FCSNNPTVGTTVLARFGSCDAGGTSLPGHNCANVRGCTAAYNQCTAVDQSILVGQQNCLLNAAVCQPGGEFAWALSIAACQGDAGTLSTLCTGYFLAQAADGGC
ncbi:MAG TPA: hypothetical protein VH208_12920, partial [Myxococcaceae bacterium]|nr:hypothetical protein [Myxococcaceae bacterium]